MFTRRKAMLGVAAAAMISALPFTTAPALADSAEDLPREKVALVAPPFVHPHEQVAPGGPKVVEFTMTIQEKEIVVDDEGTTFQAMTFDGSVPGPMMVVHEGDYVELTLVNPEMNSLAHNIDFHAATGGMAAAS